MPVKVYIHREEAGFPSKTSKISVPGKWLTGKNVSDVINLFATGYNKEYPDNIIVTESSHLATSNGDQLFSNVVCGTVLEDRMDYYVKSGTCIKQAAITESADSVFKLKCKNYGCNKYFTEEENDDSACQHHSGPPVFHDTAKYWSCCGDRKKAYDFETFQQIPYCSTGRHSVVNAGMSISASPNATVATASEAAPVLKSIADFNTTNSAAPTAASNAAKIVTAPRKSSRSADGLTAKCQRKGCQQQFTVADNDATACTYHKGQAVFHDAVKFWSCCPERRCYDFDEFLAVPGCAKGCHDDGVIDLDESVSLKAGGSGVAVSEDA